MVKTAPRQKWQNRIFGSFPDLQGASFAHSSMCFAGYLLADDPQGETPLIPSEVMEYSIKHSTEVDINTTLQILGSPGEKASSIPGFNRTDSVIRYKKRRGEGRCEGLRLEVEAQKEC